MAYVPPSGFGAGATDVLRRELLIGAAIAMGVALGVGVLIAAVVAARTRRIAAAAEAIAEGDFERPVHDRMQDEIGSLAASIDEMRQRLALAFQTLSQERERLRGIVDRLEEAVIAVDADGRVDFANPRPTSSASTPWSPASPSPPSSAASTWPARPATPRRAAATFERELVTPDGRYLRVQIAPLPPPPRRAALVVVTDHTAAQLREEAERRFIANASHELRTPLAAIVAAAEVLAGGAKDEPATRDAFIEDIQRVSRMRLALDVLDERVARRRVLLGAARQHLGRGQDGRQRRAQLVRRVGDEPALGLLAQLRRRVVGDHHQRGAPRRRRQRRDLDAQVAAVGGDQLALEARSARRGVVRRPGQVDAAELRRERLAGHHGALAEPVGRGVGEVHPPLVVDRDHRLLQAVDDAAQPLALLPQGVEGQRQALAHLVDARGQRADLVLHAVAHRPLEVALGDGLGRGGDAPRARRDDRGDQDADEDATPIAIVAPTSSSRRRTSVAPAPNPLGGT